MDKTRLEDSSDGIITIMVLELKFIYVSIY
jgi:uncharacterized membrane protein